MRAMILAAGLGTKLRPITDRIPKPMLPVQGKPVLEHLVENLAAAGIGDLIINLHHRPEVIRDHCGDGSRWGVRIHYSHEDRLLGTAGALSPVSHLLTETFLVVYGDNLHRCPYAELVSFHKAGRGIGTILLHERSDVRQSGVARLGGDGRVLGFIEKPRSGAELGHLVNAGVYVLEPGVFRYIPSGRSSDFGREVFPSMCEAEERLYGFRLRSELVWVDSAEDYARVSAAPGHCGEGAP